MKIEEALKTLRLPTMSHHWLNLSAQADKEQWTAQKLLLTLCEYELDSRVTRRISRHKKEACLPMGKSLSSFDFSHLPDLNSREVEGLLEDLSWLENGENLLFFGPSGTGKSHLAGAIGSALIEKGYRVLFTRTTALLQDLLEAKDQHRLPSKLTKLEKYQCLILDDFGYLQKNREETGVIFELISERYENQSLIITSNQVFSEWETLFVDSEMAIAAVDRLIHHCRIFELKAESYRKRAALEKRKSQGNKNESK